MPEKTRISPDQEPAQESLVSTQILKILEGSTNKTVKKNDLFSSPELKQFSPELISNVLANLDFQNLIKQIGDSKNPDLTLIPKKPVRTQVPRPKITTGKLSRQFGRYGFPIQPFKK